MASIQIPAWNQYPWLRHGFSTRLGGVSTVYASADGDPAGDLNLGMTAADDHAAVTANRQLFLQELACSGLVTLRQIHSAKVVVATRVGSAGEGDGLMTDEPGLTLGIQTADCTPILLADVSRRVVAGFHAGWRGTAARIVELGVEQMRWVYGSQPEDLIAAVGPAIGVCCYSVGEELYAQFATNFPYAPDLFRRQPTGLYLDLAEANRRQLLAAGLSPDRISVVAQCTACAREGGRRLFFSHRAEHGHTGRMMSVIAIAAES
jgi:YfiH family protein